MTSKSRKPAPPPADPERDDVTDWSAITVLAESDFDSLVDRLNDCIEGQKRLKEEEREIRAEVATLLIKSKQKTVGWRGRKVTRKDGTSPARISEELLVKKAKLSLDMIAKCKVPGTPYTTVVISKEKEEGGDNA